MTAQTDPYVRVYYRILDDPKFKAVDDRALGLWVRLLLQADAMYPSTAILPRRVHEPSLAKLADAQLIELLDNDRYRIKGLAAERETRAEAARFAADAKHHGHAEAVRRQSERNAGGMRPASEPDADALPLRSSPIRTEPIQSAPLRSDAPRTKNPFERETDEERLARYRALRDDPSKNADIRYAAKNEVERLEAILRAA